MRRDPVMMKDGERDRDDKRRRVSWAGKDIILQLIEVENSPGSSLD